MKATDGQDLARRGLVDRHPLVPSRFGDSNQESRPKGWKIGVAHATESKKKWIQRCGLRHSCLILLDDGQCCANMPLAAEIGVQTIMNVGARHVIRIRGQRIRHPSTTNVDPCS